MERPNMTESVAASLSSATWLSPADEAIKSLAFSYAAQIDEAVADGDDAHMAKVLGWHGPHLLNTLRALGCTPSDRKALAVESDVKGRLGELRALRGA